MSKQLVAFLVAAILGVAAGGALSAGQSPRARTPQVSIVACHDVVKAPAAGGSFYWKCVGPFALGIPHSSPKLAFLVENRGFAKGSTFSLNFVDNKTGQPLTSPVKFGPVKFDPGLWRLGFSGPFSQMTLRIEATLNGRKLPGASVFRFV